MFGTQKGCGQNRNQRKRANNKRAYLKVSSQSRLVT